MTLQEIFDTVVNGLRKQGCKSEGLMKNPADDPDDPPEMTCLYRGPNSCKCAAGLLIPDDLYDPKMEANIFYNVICSYPKLAEYFDLHVHEDNKARAGIVYDKDGQASDKFALISCLQGIHDASDIETWEQDWKNTAARYGLVYTAP